MPFIGRMSQPTESGRTSVRWLPSVAAYLWSGWGAVASLCLFLALWDLGNRHYGALIVPAPTETFAALWGLWQDQLLLDALHTTARRALTGFGLAVLLGSALGIAAGLSVTAATVARPLVTVLMGIPPISWVVLALIWFGTQDAGPVFTVLIATLPVIFTAGLQGSRTRDGRLGEMAQAFSLSRRQRLSDVYLPHIVSYLLPAWIVALGTAWKVVVMAELLITVDGVGAELAVARTQLDTARALAWVVSVVALLLAVEYLALEPFRRRIERWRDSGG